MQPFFSCLPFVQPQIQKKWIGVIFFIVLVPPQVSAQDTLSSLSKTLEQYAIKGSVGLQFWGTYGYGMKVQDETGNFLSAKNRFNVQLRRSRFSLKGDPYRTLSFKVTASLDLVGHDVLSATEAGGNNGSSPQFRIWNAWVKWQRKPEDDRSHFLAGYFVSPIGRESNNGALISTSFEKAWSQNYLRRHIVGIGPGRAMGLMLAGQFHSEENNRHLTYEIALQSPLFSGIGGNTTGLNYSPLITGRLAFQFGDPEHTKYTPAGKVNYFNKRDGLTLGMAATRQGKTASFAQNSAYGFDFLLNYSSWQLDGEMYRMQRFGSTSSNMPIKTKAYTGYLRIGHNIDLPYEFILETVISYWFYRGGKTLSQINAANYLTTFSGKDSGLDIGANLYFNPKMKLSLFWAFRQGNTGQGTAEQVNNNFFRQPGIGIIERGNYIGLGWVSIF